MPELPAALRAYVIHHLGTPLRTHSLPATTAYVWRIELDHREPIILKQHARGRGFTQERTALQQVAPLADRVPQLLAADEALRAIAITTLPGEDAITSPPTPALFHAAGTLRAAFDRLAITEDDPIPLADAIAARRDRWLARATRWLDATTITRAHTAIDPTAFTHRTRRFCHRDFGPHNWRRDPTRPAWLGCLDFGHTRPDDPLVDLVRATAPPHDDPTLVAAFLAGWGIASDAAAETALRWLHAIATATWGREHNDPVFTALGDAALAGCNDR
ncbi:MAG TPA: aminoglycoside phosphotransferase family protein [Nannocystaceae bacterium]|nr:aminoglycoside phosphotransferase family protein [Nannocystaceae bacterium]